MARCRLIWFPLLAFLCGLAPVQADDLIPGYKEIRIPPRYTYHLEQYRYPYGCMPVRKGGQWQRGRARGQKIRVHTTGPHGSGRFWHVTVLLPGKGEDERGFCFEATTVGWRTLRNFRKIKWLQDVDGDGHDELIVWDSFALTREPTNADYAIVAWAYSMEGNKFVLNRKATAILTRELVTAYKKQLKPVSKHLSGHRRKAASMLQRLAQ